MGGLFGTKPQTIRDDYGTLNPEQKAMFKTLSPQITNLASTGAPLYTGEFNSPYTDVEQANLNRQTALASNVADWSSKFQPGQLNPEVESQEMKSLMDTYRGTTGIGPGIQDIIQEQYAGPGGAGYWGNARANAVLGGLSEYVTNPYLQGRSNRLQNSYGNALNYASGATGVNQQTGAMAAVPRLIKDYGLDAKYNEWIRGQNTTQQYINDALSFMNLSTVTNTYVPGQKGMIGDLGAVAGAALGSLGGPRGMAMGAQIGGALGGSFDRSGDSSSSLGSALGNLGMMQSMAGTAKGTSPFSWGGSSALTANTGLQGMGGSFTGPNGQSFTPSTAPSGYDFAFTPTTQGPYTYQSPIGPLNQPVSNPQAYWGYYPQNLPYASPIGPERLSVGQDMNMALARILAAGGNINPDYAISGYAGY